MISSVNGSKRSAPMVVGARQMGHLQCLQKSQRPSGFFVGVHRVALRIAQGAARVLRDTRVARTRAPNGVCRSKHSACSRLPSPHGHPRGGERTVQTDDALVREDVILGSRLRRAAGIAAAASVRGPADGDDGADRLVDAIGTMGVVRGGVGGDERVVRDAAATRPHVGEGGRGLRRRTRRGLRRALDVLAEVGEHASSLGGCRGGHRVGEAAEREAAERSPAGFSVMVGAVRSWARRPRLCSSRPRMIGCGTGAPPSERLSEGAVDASSQVAPARRERGRARTVASALAQRAATRGDCTVRGVARHRAEGLRAVGPHELDVTPAPATSREPRAPRPPRARREPIFARATILRFARNLEGAPPPVLDVARLRAWRRVSPSSPRPSRSANICRRPGPGQSISRRLESAASNDTPPAE